MLKNFRLISREQVAKIGNTPVIYALCFDVDGLLIRVGWSKYPGCRLASVLREQVSQPKEIWIADFGPECALEVDAYDHLRSFARRVHRVINFARVSNELFRLPMAELDAAFTTATAMKF